MAKKLRDVVNKLLYIFVGSAVLMMFASKGAVGQDFPATPADLSTQETSGELTDDTTATPSVRFLSSTSTVHENSAMVTLELQVSGTNGRAVSVDVVFNQSGSTAKPGDINNFQRETVTFSGSDPDGTIKSVDIEVTDDSAYEGEESAIFELKNFDNAAPGTRGSLVLVIEDNDTPNVVISEIMASPGGEDTNRDGIASPGQDEYIEIHNRESKSVDVGGWALSTGTGQLFEIPHNTVIPPNSALLLFGGGEPKGSFGGSEVLLFRNALSLDDKGGRLLLQDGNARRIHQVAYSNSIPGTSLVVEGSRSDSRVIMHTSPAVSDRNYSPGAEVDGSSFHSSISTGIFGGEGWRMISTPSRNTTFNTLFNNFWIQGIPGSSAPSEPPNIYTWNETNGGSFDVPVDISQELQPGKGYFIYLFEDNDRTMPGTQGGFPKVVSTERRENESPVSVAVQATDSDDSGFIDGNEGWNLLGNPFNTDIRISAMMKSLEKVNEEVNVNILVWDQDFGGGNGKFVALGQDDFIKPFQAFFVHFPDAGFEGKVIFDKSDFNKKVPETADGQEVEARNLTLTLENDSYYDTYRISFKKEGSTGKDRFDSPKLFSLNRDAINLYSIQDGDRKLAINTLPPELDTRMEIPISFETPRNGTFTFRWPDRESVSDDWSFYLVDGKTGKEIDLSVVDSYEFEVNDGDFGFTARDKHLEPALTSGVIEESPRFTLQVVPGTGSEIENSTEIPEAIKLNQNYPNPFNPSTTISYELAEKTHVELSVYTIVGQKVVTLVDEVKEAGVHEEVWNASEMPSGIYIAQLEANGVPFIRKMTLIK